jgi:hypothetical protein
MDNLRSHFTSASRLTVRGLRVCVGDGLRFHCTRNKKHLHP